MKLLAALQFLTALPVFRRREISAANVGASVTYFPLVGLLLGAVLAGVNWLLGLILPPAIVNIFIIITLIFLTGALHIDGFIDTCDALFGRGTPQEKWRIMSDSRVGSFGVVGAFCLLLLVYFSLGEIAGTYKTTALILMPVLGRWSMVYTIFAFPYAKPAGLGKAFKEQANWRKLVLATLLMLAATLGILVSQGLLFIFAGLVLILAVWVIAGLLGLFLKKRFDGLTGDSYGTINEVSQVVVLLFFILITKWWC